LDEDFIDFLDKWEVCVKQWDGFTNKGKKMMGKMDSPTRGRK